MLHGICKYEDGKRNKFIYEFLAGAQTWKRIEFKPTIDNASNVCRIENMMMLTESGVQGSRVELLKVNNNDFWSSKLCSTPLPLKHTYNYSLTSIDGVKVILAGGETCGQAYRVLASVYEGVLNERKDDVKWKKIPDFKRPRYHHTAFYLNDQLYVVGGKNCSSKWLDCSEVYDVSEGTWTKGPSLPYAMVYPIAITSKNCTFALIIGKKSGCLESTMMIVDDENGFLEVFSSNLDYVESIVYY